MKNLKFLVAAGSYILLAVLLLSNQTLRAQAKVYGVATMNEAFLASLPLGSFYYTVGYNSAPSPNIITSTVTKIAATAAMTWVWTKEFSGPNGESLALNDIQESLSGNLIVIGNAFPGTNSSANNKYVVMEISQADGSVLQAKVFTRPGNNRQLNPRIKKVSDCGALCGGGYIVSSWIDSPGADNVFAMKLDYGLNIVWANDYDAGGDDEPGGLIATPSGGAIIAGSTSTGGWRTFLLELDCQGGVVQTNAYSPSQGYVSLCYGIERAFNGDILLCGAVEIISGGRNATAMRINGGTWAPVWHRVWNFANLPQDMVFTGITQLPKTNGNVYAAGYTPDLVNGGWEPRLVKLAFSNGATNVYRELGGVGGSLGSRLGISANTTKVLVPSGKVVPAGGGIGLTDAFLGVQTAAMTVCGAATKITMPSLTTLQSALAFNVIPETLSVSNYCGGNNLSWSIKDVCAVSNKPASARRDVPTEDLEVAFEMYPNPASGTVEILFPAVDTPAKTLLQVFDLNGKLLKTQVLEIGVTEANLDLTDLPQGVYLVKIGDAAVQKLTKI